MFFRVLLISWKKPEQFTGEVQISNCWTEFLLFNPFILYALCCIQPVVCSKSKMLPGDGSAHRSVFKKVCLVKICRYGYGWVKTHKIVPMCIAAAAKFWRCSWGDEAEIRTGLFRTREATNDVLKFSKFWNSRFELRAYPAYYYMNLYFKGHLNKISLNTGP